MKGWPLSVWIAIVMGAGCGGGGTGPVTPPGPPPPPPPPPPPGTVSVVSNAFNPNDLSVQRNNAVTWNWQASGHNVTFEDGVGNSGDKNQGGTHDRTFSNAGTFRYRCTNHSTDFSSGMAARVVVQ